MPRVKGPGKGGASLQAAHSELYQARAKAMEPIPEEARKDPVTWAEKHIESLQPDAAKEVEWALKFGSDTLRYTAARDSLAMKGLTTKPKEGAAVQQAMVFNFTGPVSPSGAPILPFSNAQPALPSGTNDAPVDATATPVTVSTAPSKDPK